MGWIRAWLFKIALGTLTKEVISEPWLQYQTTTSKLVSYIWNRRSAYCSHKWTCINMKQTLLQLSFLLRWGLSAEMLSCKEDVLHDEKWVGRPMGKFSLLCTKSPWKCFWQQVMGYCSDTGVRDLLSLKSFRLACSLYLKGGVCHANEKQPRVRRCPQCDSCLGSPWFTFRIPKHINQLITIIHLLPHCTLRHR